MLDDKIKNYLLAETSGKRFPLGKVPDLKDFVKEVLQGVKLWPVQKLILKTCINATDLFPKLPLTEWEKETLLKWMKNAEEPFGDKKYAQAVIRTNKRSNTPLVILLVCGRGSSKTFMCSILIGYFIRVLVSLLDPHKFFGLAKVKPIFFQCLAAKESQAVSLFRPVKTHVKNCGDLQGTYDEFRDSLQFGGVLEARAYTANANTARGEDTFCYYHEETAFCNEDSPNNEKSFKQCYDAIRPAVKNRFGKHGILLFATSAGLKGGQTYRIYKQIMDGTIKNCVMFQLAIWEINPNFSKADFEQEYAEDRITADAEHGSQFVDSKNAFFTEDQVHSCIDPELERLEKGDPAIEYWMRLDPSRVHDRYAISIGHKEVRYDESGYPTIHAVIDYVHYWEAQWYRKDNNEPYTPQNAKERSEGFLHAVDMQEVLAYCHDLIARFNIIGVSSDQFESQYIIEELEQAYGTKDYPFGFIRPITEKSNWLAYRNILKMVVNRTFHIYHEPAFIEEACVAMRYNKNKPMDFSLEDEMDDDTDAEVGVIYTVKAPRSGSVKTDDVLDVVTFNVWDMMINAEMTPYDLGTVQADKREGLEKINKMADNEYLLKGLPEDW